MTQVLLRAIRHAPVIRVFTYLSISRRPIAHWVRGEDGRLRYAWAIG